MSPECELGVQRVNMVRSQSQGSGDQLGPQSGLYAECVAKLGSRTLGDRDASSFAAKESNVAI